MDTKNVNISKSTEVILSNTAKFAIISVQLNANIPLSVVRGKLCMKYLSISFILQCLVHALFIFNLIYIGLNFEELSKVSEQYSSTEFFLLKIVGPIYMIISVFCRFNGFWSRYSTLQFWKSNVAVLDLFLRDSSTQASATTSPKSSALLNESLARIRASLRNYLATLLVLIISTQITAYSYYDELYTAFSAGFVLYLHFFMFVNLTHVAYGVWLSFFLKHYTALFQNIQATLRLLNEAFSEINLNTIDSHNISGEERIQAELNDCYRLFIKVRNQVREFCANFQMRLITDCLLASSQVIFCIFLLLRWVMESEPETKRMGSFSLLLQSAIFGKLLYCLGTDGSRLSSAASDIMEELNHLYNNTGPRLDFRCRQTLKIFLMKISTNPPAVDVAQFFIIDRKWISTVRF